MGHAWGLRGSPRPPHPEYPRGRSRGGLRLRVGAGMDTSFHWVSRGLMRSRETLLGLARSREIARGLAAPLEVRCCAFARSPRPRKSDRLAEDDSPAQIMLPDLGAWRCGAYPRDLAGSHSSMVLINLPRPRIPASPTEPAFAKPERGILFAIGEERCEAGAANRPLLERKAKFTCRF
jgi:hypothetical protein